MAAALPAIAAGIEAVTGAVALGQDMHENNVQYQQDALTGSHARTQNERLLNGPGQFPGYSESVQGYTSPGFAMYGSTPQFTDGAPQQGSVPGDTQVSAQPVGQPIFLSPDGQISSPGIVPGIGNAVMPQQSFDVGSAMGGGPMYLQQGSPFTSFIPGPFFFTDTQAPAPTVVQAMAPTSRKR